MDAPNLPPLSTTRTQQRPGLVRNVVWNLAGSIIAVSAAVIAVPLLISGIGIDRFGILTIMLVVIGYFGFFDIGLGRALTKLVAERLESGRDHENPELIWTALSLLFVLGLLGAAGLWLATPWIASKFNIPDEIFAETVTSLYYLAASVPLVVLTPGLRALLDAHHRFDIANIIRVPSALWLTLGPVAVLPFSTRVDHLVIVLIAGRAFFFVVHLIAYTRIRPGFFASFAVRPRLIGMLLSFGGWVTVSNVALPLIAYFDRFVIAAVASAAAVAYYSTPYEVVVKLALVPDAIAGVLFPAFAAAFVSDRRRAVEMFDQGERAVFILVLPVVLVFSTLAYDLLSLWVGDSFAQESYRVAQWLCAGVLIAAGVRIPFAAIQALGRADLTAKVCLAALPLYVPALFFLIHTFGLQGAAAAWGLLAAVEMFALLVIARRLMPELGDIATREVRHLGCGLVVIWFGALLPNLPIRLAFLAIVLVAFATIAWRITLTAHERDLARAWIKPIFVKQT